VQDSTWLWFFMTTAESDCQVPQFAVFFSDGAGFGIELVQALDAAHAKDIARAQHPSGRLSAVPAEPPTA